MAKFAFNLVAAGLAATKDAGSVIAAAASPRRFKLYDIVFGTTSAPADAAMRWEIQQRTAAATGGTAVTGRALDVSDTIASTLVGNQAPTTNGAGSNVYLAIGLNQRATMRWVAAPGGELVCPATTSSGFGANLAVVSTGTPDCAVEFHVDEL